MKEIFVIYWSSTGNTQIMAEAVGEGVVSAGGTATVLEVSSVNLADLKEQEVFALGASAKEAEELDEEMDSFVTQIESLASGKKIALFGSYDWGDGEWMRDWMSRMERAGATVIGGEDAIAQLEPDEAAKEMCRSLGELLMK